MPGELLIELGTEEIPSDYLDNAMDALKRLAEDLLKEHRIGGAEDLEVFGTPRRLVLVGPAFAGTRRTFARPSSSRRTSGV